MDLVGFMQIGTYDELLQANGIVIPRLRGIRYMKEETIDLDADNFNRKSVEVSVCEDLIRAIPRWTYQASMSVYSMATDRLIKKYIKNGNVHWHLLHGKARKKLKFAIKKQIKCKHEQLDMFKKYIGRADVLMVHARIGGQNWSYYNGQALEREPWFLGKVDDSFDNTYCDIYCKLEVLPNEGAGLY